MVSPGVSTGHIIHRSTLRSILVIIVLFILHTVTGADITECTLRSMQGLYTTLIHIGDMADITVTILPYTDTPGGVRLQHIQVIAAGQAAS